MELATLSPLFNLAGWISVFAMVIISVAKGWLVPRFTVDRWLEVMNERISDLKSQRDDYKKASDASSESIRLLSEGQRELIRESRITASAVQAMRALLDRSPS